MAVQKASTQLPQDPAELDCLIKDLLNSDLKASRYTHACRGNSITGLQCRAVFSAFVPPMHHPLLSKCCFL